ncbi:MAG: response regulator [Proteobacteria bacterium]|nr:response regulator [Pseudomonadota bacterium]
MWHNGGIRIKSDPGKGTVVQCYFPSAEEQKQERPETRSIIQGGAERILLIDDEESIVKLGKLRLERLGYQVETETNPVRALTHIKENPEKFDLVIIDLTMPQMTGDHLICQLKDIHPQLKSIICTGYNDKMDQRKAKETGASALLIKPFEHLVATYLPYPLFSPTIQPLNHLTIQPISAVADIFLRKLSFFIDNFFF